MLSTCCLKFPVRTDIQNNDTNLISCYQTHVSSCPELVNEITMFHRRFGHPHTQILLHLLKHVPSINLSNKSIKQVLKYICEACQLGKNHKLYFLTTETKTSQILELIHTYLWGPSSVLSRDGYTYYISFIDDFSRYTWIYPLKLKPEALSVFKLFRL